jgi:hypothetical protein
MKEKAMYKRLVVFTILILALSGCGVSGMSLQGNGQPLLQTLAQGGVLGSYREADPPEAQIIAGAQDIDSLARQLPGNPPRASDNPDLVNKLRQLDYTRFFAILVTQGQKEPRGFQMMVQQITRQDDHVTVQTQFIGPKPGEGQPMVVFDPYHLVAVSKDGAWARQIQFELAADGKVVAHVAQFIP